MYLKEQKLQPIGKNAHRKTWFLLFLKVFTYPRCLKTMFHLRSSSYLSPLANRAFETERTELGECVDHRGILAAHRIADKEWLGNAVERACMLSLMNRWPVWLPGKVLVTGLGFLYGIKRLGGLRLLLPQDEILMHFRSTLLRRRSLGYAIRFVGTHFKS